MDHAEPTKGYEAARPVSAHRLFPAIVAAWFALLLGAGFMVLPGLMIERLVGASGISSLIPAAAPPLGNTARILISLAAAVAGAALGFAIARKVAASQNAEHAALADMRRSVRKKEEQACRPISAKEELGSELLDSPPEEERFRIPLRNRAPAAENEADLGPRSFSSEDVHWAGMPDIEPEPVEDVAPEPELSAPFGNNFTAWDDSAPLETEPPFPDFRDDAPVFESAAPAADSASTSRDETPLDQLGLAGLTERLGRSLRAKRLPPAASAALLERLKTARDEGTMGLDTFAEKEEAEADESESGDPDADYSPLLAIPPDRPISIFPETAPRPFDAPRNTGMQPAPEIPHERDTAAEHALRSALATLRRMNGTA